MMFLKTLVYFSLIGAASARRRILVLGGNGMLGSEYVHRLVESATGDDDVEITLLNRGNWYWDSATRIAPRANRILTCDRNRIRHCEPFASSHDDAYDVVVDFSSYRINNIADVIEVLTNRVGLYVYIGTDSVYDVTVPSFDDDDVEGAGRFRREEDAVRPSSPTERRRMRELDDYGHQKLGCEELLVEQRRNGGFPYVVLRLPDVIGPRDNTNRWWAYLLWLETHGKIGRPIYMTSYLANQRLSFVYAPDVADLILRVTEERNRDAVRDQVFNLAFRERPTLKELLMMMGREIDLSSDDIVFSDDTVKSYLYPSVRCGPIDTKKAERLIHWEPTTLDEAVRDTVAFYQRAMILPQFELQRRQVMDYFKRNWVPSDKHDEL